MIIRKTAKTITIRVTRENIQDGQPTSHDSCALALACSPSDVSVDGETILFWADDRTYRLPRRAEDFVSDFDIGKKVKPFTFSAMLVE